MATQNFNLQVYFYAKLTINLNYIYNPTISGAIFSFIFLIRQKFYLKDSNFNSIVVIHSLFSKAFWQL